MEIFPHPFRRGDALEGFEGSLVGGIGAFSSACVGGQTLNQPLEVLLVEGSVGSSLPAKSTGLRARVGDATHRVYEGPLTAAKVSFTLEAFRTPASPATGEEGGGKRGGENIVAALRKDSCTLSYEVAGELRHFILDKIEKEKFRGALLHITGTARRLKIYGHTNPLTINDQNRTFDETHDVVGIEGWGNLSFIDGRTPFIHVHGTYAGRGVKKGGHFIMDDATPLMIEKATLLVYPFASLVRVKQGEDFPIWKV